jgi:hypothetical protein
MLTRAATLLGVALASAACSSDGDTSDEARAELAAEAFVWGYPLVVSARTMQRLGGIVGVNTLFNQAAPLGASTSIIVSPNQDTFYSVAALDLRSEPVVLTVPDVSDRYWTYQFLDAWTDSFHYVGTRATGGTGGSFVIAPPGWDGELPVGAELVVSPTPRVFLLGRYLVGDEADMAIVNGLERTLEPLSAVTGEPAPEPPPDLGAPPGAPTETGNDGGAFFDELGDAVAVDPPATDADTAALARFAELGIGRGLHPFAEGGDDGVLAAGVEKGLARIVEAAPGAGAHAGGWTMYLGIDAFEDDPLLRAIIAKTLWGANIPAEAVYARSLADSTGAPYAGTTDYVMHFDAGALPPVDAVHGFWSVTLYGPDGFFVENALDRYAISDRTPGIVFAPDGSLDLSIQHAAPPGGESNWLPAPAGAFHLVLRIYLPSAAVTSGGYACPPVLAR